MMILKQILFILFFAASAMLYSQTCSLVIFTASGDPFQLSVNQKEVNPMMQSNVKVFQVNHGWQKVEIKLMKNNEQLVLHDSILLINQTKYDNKEFTYVLLEDDKKLKLDFKSVSQPSGPEIPPVPEAPKEKMALVDNSIYGNLYQAKNNIPNFYTNYNSETSTCQIPLSSKDIDYALNLLKNVIMMKLNIHTLIKLFF